MDLKEKCKYYSEEISYLEDSVKVQQVRVFVVLSFIFRLFIVEKRFWYVFLDFVRYIYYSLLENKIRFFKIQKGKVYSNK